MKQVDKDWYTGLRPETHFWMYGEFDGVNKMADVSLQTMVKRICGMHNTRDLSQWENEFVGSIANYTDNGTSEARVSRLSEKQQHRIKELFDKFFSA